MQNSDARIIIYVDVYFLTIILDGKILRAKLDKNGRYSIKVGGKVRVGDKKTREMADGGELFSIFADKLRKRKPYGESDVHV